MFRRLNRRDERGVTLVVVALCITAIMGLAALVIDGGFVIADHRQDQNASDAAAMAGANAMNDAWGTTGSESSVYNAVLAKVSSDSNNGSFTCTLIDQYRNPLGACPTTNTGLGFPSGTDGVTVSVANSRTTSLAQAAGGPKTLQASATASAQVEQLLVTSGSAPILLCAVASSDSRSGGSGINPPILYTDNSINPNAVGQTYDLKGNGVMKECGTNGSYKGIADQSQDYPIPGGWSWVVGNHSGPFRVQVAGECNGETVGCVVVIPLCYEDSSLPSNQLWCVTLGEFRITATDANSDTGVFLGTAFTSTSGAGGGIPNSNQPRVVNLSQ